MDEAGLPAKLQGAKLLRLRYVNIATAVLVLAPSSFLFLVVRPGAPSSVIVLTTGYTASIFSSYFQC